VFGEQRRPRHSIAILNETASLRQLETFTARCSCGWRGTAFSGQQAGRGAQADGEEHIMRAERSPDGYDPRWPADE
jgi:hypothetical protein